MNLCVKMHNPGALCIAITFSKPCPAIYKQNGTHEGFFPICFFDHKYVSDGSMRAIART